MANEVPVKATVIDDSKDWGNNMAMDGSGYSLSDIAAISDGGMGGCNSFVLILLFAMIFGWGGNGFGNNGNAVNDLQSDMQRGFDNQNSMANQREILAATNQSFHDTLGVLQDKYGELQRDIAGLAVGQANALAQQNQCCCETKMLISETAANQRYESAMQTAAIQQAVQAEGAATRAMIQQDKIEALQQQVNQLQLAQAMQGVVRYPDSFSYNAGANPFCGCNWGNCNM